MTDTNEKDEKQVGRPLEEILGCTTEEMLASGLDMDSADDALWLEQDGVDLQDREAVKAALRIRYPRMIDYEGWAEAVMSWLPTITERLGTATITEAEDRLMKAFIEQLNTEEQ